MIPEALDTTNALEIAATEWLATWQKLQPGYQPLSQQEVESLQSKSYPAILPQAWRRWLTLAGHGGHIKFHWPKPILFLRPDLAAEHQAETDDGAVITSAGMTVIGYIEGAGDCIVMRNEGEDPHVYLHSHGGAEDQSLGTLSQFMSALNAHLLAGTGLAITSFIEAILKHGSYHYLGKSKGRHSIMFNDLKGQLMMGDIWEVDFRILRAHVPFEPGGNPVQP